MPRAAFTPGEAPLAGHRARWYVWSAGERMPHESSMRGAWGWDVVCECGWDSRTGGAIRPRVLEAHRDHLSVVRWVAEHPEDRAAFADHFTA